MTLTRLQNTTEVMYNGYRPGAIALVENPEPLLLAGFTIIGTEEENQELELVKMTKAQLLAKAEELWIETNSKNTVAQLIELIKAKQAEGDQDSEGVNLEELSDEELKKFAEDHEVEISEEDTREEIIEKILAKQE